MSPNRQSDKIKSINKPTVTQVNWTVDANALIYSDLPMDEPEFREIVDGLCALVKITSCKMNDHARSRLSG